MPTGGPFGKNKRIFNDEFITAEIGQVGTQFDGLGHIGVLLDIAGDKGRMLEKGEEITLADVQGAMAKQGLADLHTGDAVLINTGWGSLWMKDNARFDRGRGASPLGIGTA